MVPLEGKSSIEVFECPLKEGCKIIVSPFLGNRYGINKDSECEAIGDLISECLKEKEE